MTLFHATHPSFFAYSKLFDVFFYQSPLHLAIKQFDLNDIHIVEDEDPLGTFGHLCFIELSVVSKKSSSR